MVPKVKIIGTNQAILQTSSKLKLPILLIMMKSIKMIGYTNSLLLIRKEISYGLYVSALEYESLHLYQMDDLPLSQSLKGKTRI